MADTTAPTTGPSPTRTYTSLRAAWIPLVALCLAFFVEMVDNTLLNIALPTIGRDLGSGTTSLQWITGIYSLTFGGLLLTAGSLADRLGRRRVLLTGLTGFGLISVLVVAVSSAGELIALRAALGVAAAAMAPVTASLVFRLFDDQAVRMRAISLMVIVGMSGFALGPLLAGSALPHMRWEWLLVVNAPIALIAWIGVRAGVPADRADELTTDALDIPGALLSITAMGLACFSLTSGVEHGWSAPLTLASVIGAVAAVAGFVSRERRAAAPMLDLTIFSTRTIRGATIAQLGSSVTMAGAMFGLILHFQYAYGWSPAKAGLANLPMIITMVVSGPLAEAVTKRLGHRVTCLIAAGLLTSSLVGLSWGVEHGYLVIAIAMVAMTLGLRIIMTVCAVALIESMPQNRTSLGAALNDTSQEIGSSIGVAVFGTVLAAVVGTTLPSGAWDAATVATFFHGERVTFAVLAGIVGVVTFWGASTLTSSRTAEEHPAEEPAVAERRS